MPALDLDFFKGRLGQTFQIALDNETIGLRLTEVSPIPPPPPRTPPAGTEPATGSAPRSLPFSLLFTGPASPLLRQKIYTFREESSEGGIDIFIVPIGQRPGSAIYQAVFG